MTVAAIQMVDMKVRAHSVMTGVDAPPVLEPAEHILDAEVLSVEHCVVRNRPLAVDL